MQRRILTIQQVLTCGTKMLLLLVVRWKIGPRTFQMRPNLQTIARLPRDLPGHPYKYPPTNLRNLPYKHHTLEHLQYKYRTHKYRPCKPDPCKHRQIPKKL